MHLPEISRHIDLSLGVYEHSVRKLRRMRTQKINDADMALYVDMLERILHIDAHQALEDAKAPGPLEGYPYLVAAELKEAKRTAA